MNGDDVVDQALQGEEVELEGLGSFDGALILSDDTAHRVRLEEVSDDVDTVHDVLRDLEGQIGESYERQLNQHLDSMAERLRLKEQELEDAKHTLFREAIETAAPLLNRGWTYDGMSNRLIHEGRIEAKRVKNNGEVYRVPEDRQGEWYVEDLSVQLADRLTDISAGDARHCNVNETGRSVCTGSLGTPDLKEGLEALPNLLRTLNLDDPLNSSEGAGYNDAVELWRELDSDGESEEAEVWTVDE